MSIKGMDLAEGLYEDCFKDILERDFKAYKEKIALGLVGRGSDCYGYDDEASKDHDWGPGFCVFVTKDTFDAIGSKLEEAYLNLPSEYKGFKCAPTVSKHKRRGVFVIEDFYKELLGKWPLTEDDYLTLPTPLLSMAVNGKVFTDPEGIFTSYRNTLLKGYPKAVQALKISESYELFKRSFLYNYSRVINRGDELTASVFKAEGLREAMKLAHFIENKYPPVDKWLYRSSKDLKLASDFCPLLEASFKSSDPTALDEFFKSKI